MTIEWLRAEEDRGRSVQHLIGKRIIASRLMSSLPESPESIDTVVLVTEEATTIATYSGGGRYLQWVFTVTVIDWRNQAVVARETFYGEKSPPAAKAPGDMYGEKPKRKVMIAWLSGVGG